MPRNLDHIWCGKYSRSIWSSPWALGWIVESGWGSLQSFSFFIFQKNWKIKKKKKTEVTLILILRFNLRLRGYSIWSASTSRTIYIKISGLEHLTASKQPEVLEGLLDVSKGRTRSNQKDVLTTWSTRRRPAKYSTPIGFSYEELEGLTDPGQRDCS